MEGSSERTIIVIPCYNEAARLELSSFSTCLDRQPNVDFLFVNDGSCDETPGLLEEFSQQHPGRVDVLTQELNGGKAEAVRVGMLQGFDREALFVGYWDADLATPLAEIPRFIETFEEKPERQIVIGSRVNLLGRSIERRAMRHYLGRVAATIASLVLGLAVYDTQCGAKLFRSNARMRALFQDPFLTGWVFDVEIIARLIQQLRREGGPEAKDWIYELPLDRWHDIAGSNIKTLDFFTAFIEIARIRHRYLRPGAHPGSGER